MEERIINQPIALTDGHYKSTIGSERVMVRILEALQPHMNYKNRKGKPLLEKGDTKATIFKTRVLTLETKKLLPNGSQNYSFLKKTFRFLKSQEIRLRGVDRDGDYELFTGLIVQFKYYLNNEVVKVEVSEDVLNYLVNNSLGYTRFALDIAFNSSSSYTMRIYKMVSHWRDKEEGFERDFKLDYLRKALKIEPQKYVRPSGFLKRVLEPAQKELKEKADVYFELKEPLKEGRKVVGWKISIHKKEEGKSLEKNTLGREENQKYFLPIDEEGDMDLLKKARAKAKQLKNNVSNS